MIMGVSSAQISAAAAADGFDRSQRSAPMSTVGGTDQTVPKAALPPQAMRRPPQQQQRAALRCPRCDSANTKFCYYNNYSRSQPRHFCRACRRHWTNGGTLRNVPFGGRRKTKRPKPFHRPAPPKSTICDDDDTEVTMPIPTDGAVDAAAVGPQPSHQVLPPPPSVGRHQLLRMPLITSPDYMCRDNGENDGSFFSSAFLPLPLAPVFGGDLPVSHGAGAGRAYSAHSFQSSFPSSPLIFTPVDDALELEDAGISMAVPWELLPPSSSSSCLGADSAVTTGGGPTFQEPCSPSSGYWGSCWDDLASFLPPDDPTQATAPPLPPPQDRLQLP